MKRLLNLLFLAPLLAQAASLTPFEYWAVDSVGNPVTNTITIEPWPATNAIVGVGTNVVAAVARTYTPTTNGYISGVLAPNTYRLTVSGFNRGVTFGISESASTQNLAQVAGFPVVAFKNFTIAQFSDAGTAAYSNTASFFLSSLAGTAAYSNATAFTLRSYAGVIAAAGFTPATNSFAGITGALGYTPPTNTSAALVAVLGFTPATNSESGIVGALGYTPAAATLAGMTNALGYFPATNVVGLSTNVLVSDGTNAFKLNFTNGILGGIST